MTLLACLILGLLGPAALAAPPPQQDARSEDVPLRLRYASFDPLAGEPLMSQSLHLDDYSQAGGAGPYIVQCRGPIQPGWQEAISKAGGRIDSYLPDYAYVVGMDDPTRARVAQLDFVRWVGIYQPAYKIAPDMTPNPTGLYRVLMAGWIDLEAARHSLAASGVQVAGEGQSLVVSLAFDRLPELAQMPDVMWIEAYRLPEKHNDIAAGIMKTPVAWTSGYDGTGQIVTISDTGLDTGVDAAAVGDIHLDFDNRVSQISSWPVLSEPGCISNPGADDGASDVDSGHGTHVAGSVAGDGTRSSGQYRGSAHGATLTFQAVEQLTKFTGLCAVVYGTQDYLLTGIPLDLNDLFQQSYGWGARIHTNSWGGDVDGEYTDDSQAADEFTWDNKDFTILFSAGNAGVDADADGYVDEDSMGSPATAKNVITIGASENLRNVGGYNPYPYGSGSWAADYPADPTKSDLMSDNDDHLAAFSSRGPTDDGRIKPDLVAPGTNILSTRSSLATGTGWGELPALDPDKPYYLYMGGTSMATPLAAGGAAVVRDYLVDGEGQANPSSALIKALLINSAVDIDGYGVAKEEAGLPIPNQHEGWGRVDLGAATNGGNRSFSADASLRLVTGMAYTYTFTVNSSSTPLKASLVWTDYPGNPAAARQLVNNLDLMLTAPDGTSSYWGNGFANGWSTQGGSADVLNNVENVFIKNPDTGTWTAQVLGTNVARGKQPFALVVFGTGTLGSPTHGPIPEVDQNMLYMPILINSSSVTSIPNGDFESGQTVWTEYSSHGWDLILKDGNFPGSITPHGGQWAVWLGGDYDDTCFIRQNLTVPAGNYYLRYWHWIASEDSCGHDVATVRVEGKVVDEYDLCDLADTNKWVKHTVNLKAYKGQKVSLQIRSVTNSSLNSNLFIDDVTFNSDAAAAADSSPPNYDPRIGTSRKGE